MNFLCKFFELFEILLFLFLVYYKIVLITYTKMTKIKHKNIAIIIILFIILGGAYFTIAENVKGEKTMTKEINTVFQKGEPNPYGKFFTGQTYLKRLVENDGVFNSSIADVVFEPKARTNLHKHTGGQILLVMSGEGGYQERNGEIRILHKGDVVEIKPNVEHWHGASPDSWFEHISIETNLPNNESTWLEPVKDGEYK